MSNMKKNLESKWKVRFFSVWTGQALSLMSSELVQFSLVWWLTDTANSAIVLAISTMIALLPKAILGPLIGALSDRWNRRVVLIVSDIVIALSLVFLIVNFAIGTVQIWHVYVSILIRAIGGTFHMSAMLASTSLMVPKKHLSRVAGMNQMISGVVMVVSPPIGALLINLMLISNILVLDIVGAILAVVPLLFIKIPQQQSEASLTKTSSIWKNIREGFRYIKQWHGAVEVLTISTLINFIMRPAFSLIAILVINQFKGSEVEFGFMGAAIGAGFFIGGMVLSFWGGFSRKMKTSLTAIIGAGLALFVVSLAPPNAFILGLGAIFTAGFMIPFCIGPIEALIQSSVDPSMQGRIFSIMKSASTLISPLSLVIAGVIFDSLGSQIWYRWGGILAVIIGIIGFTQLKILNFGEPKSSSCGVSGIKTTGSI